MFFCYLLASGNATYIGATVDVDRRLDQHNGKYSGGARRTKGRAWKRMVYLSGIPDWRTALQVEWAWKRASRRYSGWEGKFRGILELLQSERPTSGARRFSEFGPGFSVHILSEYLERVEKIERGKRLVEMCARSHNVPSYISFPLSTFLTFPPLPYKMSSSSVTLQDLAKISASVDMMAGEIAQLRAQIEAALGAAAAAAPAAAEGKKARKPRAKKDSAEASESGAESATEGKKSRKPREKKEKPVCPAAAEGVIRFSSGGAADAKFLNNLFKAPFKLHDKEFLSAEHYFQWAKFAETDAEYAEKIRTTKNAILTRAMGKSKAHPTRENWDSVRVEMMRSAIEAKFAHNPTLAEKLLATGTARLEEENATDNFWGVGADGTGQNWTGTILMDLRKELAAEKEA